MKPSFNNGRNGDPFLRSTFDAENLFPANWVNAFDANSPSFNITEKNNFFFICITSPESRKDDFNISIEGNILTITGCPQPADSDNRKEAQEYHYNTFAHSFNLPENITADQVTASYKNGILRLYIPKHFRTGKKQVPVK